MGTLSIPLTQGKFALIDAEDEAFVAAYQWHAIHIRKHLWYAATTDPETGKRLYLHQLVCPAEALLVPDHKNGDGLDNRRSNLQSITHAQNIRKAPQHHEGATSRFRGVYFASRFAHLPNPWRAKIKVNGKSYLLGRFTSEEAAAHAYDRAARVYHRDFAVLNFPDVIGADPEPQSFVCETCGQTYAPVVIRTNRKSCSAGCAAKARKQREKAWRQANREHLREYGRKREGKRGSTPSPTSATRTEAA